MINVNQITSQLAKMPDPMLQKYAAMHKGDPYILSLAVAESNRRKEMRAGAQAQMPEQPKVADQAVAGMTAPLPEDMGIGRLPAGNMNFADGGIVAFAAGGDVERYNGEVKSLVQPDYWDPVTGELVTGEVVQNLPFSEKLSRALGWKKGLEIDPRAAIAAQKAAGQPPAVSDAYPDESRRGAATYAGKAAPATTSARAATGSPAPAQLPQASALPTASTGIGALDPNKLYVTALAKAGEGVRPEEDMLKDLNKERTAAAEQELAGTKALNEKFANAYKGRRERLDTREAELGTMKDQNFGLALLQAGAAMMSTPGSIGTAIGKGVQAGSQQYVAGIDKLNAAKEKLADARDRLDDLQLNRDEMSAREILKAESKIRDTAISGKDSMIKFVMERDKINRETAMKIVDNQIKLGITQIEQSGQNARTNAQIAAQAIPAEMRGAMLLGTGSTQAEQIESGMRRLQEIQADKSGMKAVEILATLNAKEAAQGIPPNERTTMSDLLGSAKQFTTLMYAPRATAAPTGKVLE